MAFVHLHVHSYYSFLDGAASPDNILERAVLLNMSAIALTDHNRLTGAIRFYDRAKQMGIKPIIGVEVDTEGGHLVLLCKDTSGYTSLCRLLTSAHLSNPQQHPCATHAMLKQNYEGLIALSGCSKGEIPSLLMQGKYKEAHQTAQFYKRLFRDDFFIEVWRYPSAEGQTLSRLLAELAADLTIPLVATNNVHYINPEDYAIKELLNAIDLNTRVYDLKGVRTVEQYLKSTEEMNELFSDVPQALAMTEEIASRCNLEMELGRPRFPRFTVPESVTDYEYLRKLTYAGALKRYDTIPHSVSQRIEKELNTIRHLGFCGYFLVVWDIIRWARERGIRCQARGSAVDSIVVYLLDISIVDPIEHDLLFERFMHPLRREMPDIDIDIDRRRRDEVRDYITREYGADNVACVSTISTYMARGAIRDAGKALGLPQTIIEEACSGIHFLSAHKLVEYVDNRPELKHHDIYHKPELQQFFSLCTAIDGFPKHLSVHLGGLLIGEGRLSDIVPLERSSGGDIISQYNKDDIERLGVVKMDILALPTLTVVEDTLAHIKNQQGKIPNLDRLPPDDRKTFAMLREGRTLGTFQLESPAQREMAGRLLPTHFHDIIIALSLVRPGPLKSNMDKLYLPRKHGKEPVTYLHPRLEKALGETLGVILYQEQVLRVAHDLAGMSYAEADGFRRAMTHDRTEHEMENMRDSFITSAVRNGVNNEIAEQVFEQLAAFAAYGFCKAHAATYAVLAYQTLWLKCYYPAEFFAAVLSNQPMGYYPSRVLLDEARRFGVKVLPIDINNSEEHYSVENGALRISLSQLRGISSEIVRSICEARRERAFSSLRDFIARTKTSQSVLERLIRVGACDVFGSRTILLEQTASLVNALKKRGAQPQLLEDVRIPEFRKQQEGKLEEWRAERKFLELDISAHPFDFLKLDDNVIKMRDLRRLPAGTTVTIAGSVIRYQTPPTRNGKRVLYVIMEDGTGIADVTVFSNVQEQFGEVLFREGWLLVKGKIQKRGPKSLSIIADTLLSLSTTIQSKCNVTK